VKKEVAERWKRGAETNAEGVRIEGRGVPISNRLGVLWERRELPQRGPGGALAENEFGAFYGC